MSHLPHRSYSSDYRTSLLSEYYSSNESLKTFSASKGIPFTTLSDWVKKSKQERKAFPSLKEYFTPIEISGTEISKSAEISIEFPNGVKLSLPTTSDISLISSLIKSY